jgi:hypothetical protein
MLRSSHDLLSCISFLSGFYIITSSPLDRCHPSWFITCLARPERASKTTSQEQKEIKKARVEQAFPQQPDSSHKNTLKWILSIYVLPQTSKHFTPKQSSWSTLLLEARSSGTMLYREMKTKSLNVGSKGGFIPGLTTCSFLSYVSPHF